MKDLDFDELDKAVNSLMASDGSVAADNTPPVATAATGTPAADPDPTPAADAALQTNESPGPASAVEPALASEPQAEVAPVTPAAQVVQPKRSGRFMDVFHPSSDMKSGPTPARPRQEVTLAPLAASATQPADSSPAESAESTTEPVTSVPAAWPDPLDVAEKSAEPASDEPIKSVPDGSIADDTLTSQMAELEKTLASDSAKTAPDVDQATPFLADAKVEKRPLGGQVAETLAPVDETNPMADQTAVEQDIPPTEPVPAELDKDILAVEAGGEHSDPSASPVVEGHAAASQPVDDSSTASVAAATLPSSITQQYKQQESSGDQSHAGLYDAASQDASLQHPAKKKSGWMIVLWIVLLIAVGVGGAAALYYMNFI